MTHPAVQGIDVEFDYGGRTAIERSSFEIPSGVITALIGPNGSGKSTLLNGIAGLKAPSGGSLEFPAQSGSRPDISYVLQGTKVNDTLPVTVREIVAMGRYAAKGPWGWFRELDKQAIAAAMSRMDISDIANKHMSELSGGQRQRVFIAQGLAQEHSILLLDEPVSGLDLISAQAIDDVIHDEPTRGCTVIMTTHDLAEARAADFVILLSGRVVAAGLPTDVLTIENLTTAYGASLLHVDGERLFIDDPHHHPADARHTHERTIHIESSTDDAHPPHSR